MYFNQIAVPGLGCLSYVIGCPRAKIMAVVDPKRDVKDYLRIDREEGMQITRVFNTHLHADHVSGDQELWLTTGADIYIHESAPDSDQPAVRQRLPVEHRGKPCEAGGVCQCEISGRRQFFWVKCRLSGCIELKGSFAAV